MENEMDYCGSGLTKDQFTTLKSKVIAYGEIQKRRISLSNMLWAWHNKEIQAKKAKALPMHLESDEYQIIHEFYGELEGFLGRIGHEKELKKDIEVLGKQTKLWLDWTCNVKGIGAFYTGLLVGDLYDKDFPSRSALTKYFGHHVVKGKKARRTKGVKASYDPLRQATGYKIGTSLIRLKVPGGYKQQFYEPARIELIAKHPEWIPPKGGWTKLPSEKRHPNRINSAARHLTFKAFLGHLWEIMYRHKHPGKPIPLPMHYRNVPKPLSEYIPPIHDGPGENPFDTKNWTYTPIYPGVKYDEVIDIPEEILKHNESVKNKSFRTKKTPAEGIQQIERTLKGGPISQETQAELLRRARNLGNK